MRPLTRAEYIRVYESGDKETQLWAFYTPTNELVKVGPNAVDQLRVRQGLYEWLKPADVTVELQGVA